MPVADFPLVEDFELRLEINAENSFGYHLYFFSASRGFIASFPWNDNVERWFIDEHFGIPFGNFERPFRGVEQSWDIVIAAKEDFVYILQGTFNDSAGYHCWFKVRKDLYLAEWQKAIQACREAFLTNDKQSV